MVKMLRKLAERIVKLLSGRTEAEETKTEEPDWEDELKSSVLAHSEDWGCTERDPNQKRIYLTNPEQCIKLKMGTLANRFRNTGHVEWEWVLAYTLLRASHEAVEQGKTEAEISQMFDRDLTNASGSRVFRKDQIWKHLIGWFEIIEQTDQAVWVKLKV